MKTNKQQTPGPWLAKRARTAVKIMTTDGYEVATVLPGLRGKEANARLIAAAPELLALAVRCKEYLKHPDGHHLPATEWFALNEELSAAIAKVKGGEA
jgi:hypothetical protein